MSSHESHTENGHNYFLKYPLTEGQKVSLQDVLVVGVWAKDSDFKLKHSYLKIQ